MWCKELTHLKRPWCWERLKVGEGEDREWDGWVAPLAQWTRVWVNSRSWWWTGRPGVLQSMDSQRVRHDWATELNWTELMVTKRTYFHIHQWAGGRVPHIPSYHGHLWERLENVLSWVRGNMRQSSAGPLLGVILTEAGGDKTDCMNSLCPACPPPGQPDEKVLTMNHFQWNAIRILTFTP